MPLREVTRDPTVGTQELLRERIGARLNTLRQEYENGQAQASQLETQLGSLRATMLRISGAIMVLEEIVSSEPPGSLDPSSPLEPASNPGASLSDQ
jgi:hypothetical protein